MSQYTVPKRKNPLDSSEGFTTAAPPPADVSAHIPSFVSKVPWYLNSGDSNDKSLDHQKKSDSSNKPDVMQSSSVSIKKGSLGDVKTKFVKGACENCGSTSHKRKDCLERPRKVIAKYSGDKLASDDIVPDNSVERTSFESKRDRWRGFTAEDTVDSSGMKAASNEKSKLVLSEKETFDMATSLRERSDVAKYLVNIDDEDKYYDPKSRSMRDTSGGFEKHDESEAVKKTKRFAWE